MLNHYSWKRCCRQYWNCVVIVIQSTGKVIAVMVVFKTIWCASSNPVQCVVKSLSLEFGGLKSIVGFKMKILNFLFFPRKPLSNNFHSHWRPLFNDFTNPTLMSKTNNFYKQYFKPVFFILMKPCLFNIMHSYLIWIS